MNPLQPAVILEMPHKHRGDEARIIIFINGSKCRQTPLVAVLQRADDGGREDVNIGNIRVPNTLTQRPVLLQFIFAESYKQLLPTSTKLQLDAAAGEIKWKISTDIILVEVHQ